jgi:uncharacterized protein YndB with AHSA1/START domain
MMRTLAGVFAVLGLVGSSAAVADEVSRSATFDGAPERVWAVLADPCSIVDWYSAVTACETERKDGRLIRRVTLDEGVFVERIVDYDPDEMRYAYEIVEGAPQVEGYVATIDVDPAETGAVVTWSGRFEPKGVTSAQAAAFLGSVYEKDLARLVALAQKGAGPDAAE